jgi:hypothetical protein
MIECQICKRLLGTLGGKHLKSHGITSQEYRDMFPGYQTSIPKPVSDETRVKMAASRTGKKHTDEAKAKIGAKHKGKKMAAESVAQQKVSYQKFLEENGGSPQKGMKRSQEFCDRMREVALNRPEELVQQKVEQMWEARRGSSATDKQRENYRSGRLKYMVEHPDDLPKQMFNTVPEQEFSKELINRGIEYQQSFHLGNRVFDFRMGNILIEIDGPYHRKIGFYIRSDASDDEKIEKIRLIIKKDRDKDMLARKNNYFIYRIPVKQHLPKNWYKILLDQGFDLF